MIQRKSEILGHPKDIKNGHCLSCQSIKGTLNLACATSMHHAFRIMNHHIIGHCTLPSPLSRVNIDHKMFTAWSLPSLDLQSPRYQRCMKTIMNPEVLMECSSREIIVFACIISKFLASYNYRRTTKRLVKASLSNFLIANSSLRKRHLISYHHYHSKSIPFLEGQQRTTCTRYSIKSPYLLH